MSEPGSVIARVWRSRTRASDAEEYLEYVKTTGLADLRRAEGCLSAMVWRLVKDDEAEFHVVSLWRSPDAIRGFAGPDVDKAVYYPQDHRFLLEMPERVSHLEAFSFSWPWEEVGE